MLSKKKFNILCHKPFSYICDHALHHFFFGFFPLPFLFNFFHPKVPLAIELTQIDLQIGLSDGLPFDGLRGQAGEKGARLGLSSGGLSTMPQVSASERESVWRRTLLEGIQETGEEGEERDAEGEEETAEDEGNKSGGKRGPQRRTRRRRCFKHQVRVLRSICGPSVKIINAHILFISGSTMFIYGTNSIKS